MNKMRITSEKLVHLIDQISEYVSKTSEKELAKKTNPEKWSKKEILGHLVDSGIHNLQRFTEIQFETKPYQIRPYKQDELVMANNYQNAETNEILELFRAINVRIINVINLLTVEILHSEIATMENEIVDLKYLIEDYRKHLEHHVNQIIE